MQEVTMYKAEDGTLFETAEEALKRDRSYKLKNLLYANTNLSGHEAASVADYLTAAKLVDSEVLAAID